MSNIENTLVKLIEETVEHMGFIKTTENIFDHIEMDSAIRERVQEMMMDELSEYVKACDFEDKVDDCLRVSDRIEEKIDELIDTDELVTKEDLLEYYDSDDFDIDDYVEKSDITSIEQDTNSEFSVLGDRMSLMESVNSGLLEDIAELKAMDESHRNTITLLLNRKPWYVRAWSALVG